MTDPALQQDFAEDIVLLKLVGMNPIVVHGGGPQIDEALAKLGKKGTFVQGMRVTDEETMEVVEWVLGGEVQQDIVGLINAAGGKAVGLTGRDGGLIRARKLKMLDKDDPSKEHDVGQVGEIISIDPSVVKALQDDQFIPVISPIGFGENNESYNINADVVAAKLATVLKAEKLMMLTNIAGVLDKAGKLLTDLTRAPDRRAVCRRHHQRRHAAQDRRRAGRRQERRQRGAHHRRPRAARDAAGDPDRPGLRHDDPVALRPPARCAAATMPRTVWLFDLDNTLHDAGRCVFGALNEAMSDYIARRSCRSAADEADGAAPALLAALRRHAARADAPPRREAGALPAPHPPPAGAGAQLAAATAHDLRRAARLPGRKFILTNAPRAYALRVLGALGIGRLFDGVIAIEDMRMFGQLRPKPDARMLRRVAVRLARAAGALRAGRGHAGAPEGGAPRRHAARCGCSASCAARPSLGPAVTRLSMRPAYVDRKVRRAAALAGADRCARLRRTRDQGVGRSVFTCTRGAGMRCARMFRPPARPTRRLMPDLPEPSGAEASAVFGPAGRRPRWPSRRPRQRRASGPGPASAGCRSCRRWPRMLEQPGAERITTAALAARLQVSEAALYRHFASKAQMFEGLIEFIESSVFTLVNQISRARGQRRAAGPAHRRGAAAVRREEPRHDAGDGRRCAGVRARAADRAHEPVLRPRRIAAAPEPARRGRCRRLAARRRSTRRRWPRR